jgi:uncharacterized membrane protein required for colicin V production
MNLLDLFILLWLAQYIIRGFLGGFVRMALELVGLLVALYAAGVFYDQLADVLTPVLLNSRNWAVFISFLTLYLMVYELFAYAIRWLDQARESNQRLPFAQGIRTAAGGLVERIGGGIVGLAKGNLVIGVVMSILAHFPLFGWLQALIQTSLITPQLIAFAFRLLRYLPAELYPLALWRGLLPA